jgi:hypothetical protein
MRTQDDNRGGSVTDLLVLRLGKLNHVLGSGVGNIDFSKNSVTVIGEHQASRHGENHLQHGLGTQACSDDISDSLRRKCIANSIISHLKSN